MKRQIRIQVVKPNEDAQIVDEDVAFEEKFKVVSEFVKEMVVEGAKLYAGYMLLDTIRKAVIARAASHICSC